MGAQLKMIPRVEVNRKPVGWLVLKRHFTTPPALQQTATTESARPSSGLRDGSAPSNGRLTAGASRLLRVHSLLRRTSTRSLRAGFERRQASKEVVRGRSGGHVVCRVAAKASSVRSKPILLQDQ